MRRDASLELRPIDAIAIADQVPSVRLVGERLNHLLRGPRCCGMGRHMDVKKPASLQAQHHEHVEQPKGRGRHDREVDGNGLPEMIPEERPPSLRGGSAVPRQILGDRRLRESETELQQLAVDPGCAPSGVCAMHFQDQVTQLGFDRWPPRVSRTTLPPPVQTKPAAVPTDHGLRPDDDERLAPSRPKAR